MSHTTANQRTATLRQRLLDRHDWEEGQVYGGGGLLLTREDECRICGLKLKWTDDAQNGPHNHYDYYSDGRELSLREALALPSCLEEPSEEAR